MWRFHSTARQSSETGCCAGNLLIPTCTCGAHQCLLQHVYKRAAHTAASHIEQASQRPERDDLGKLAPVWCRSITVSFTNMGSGLSYCTVDPCRCLLHTPVLVWSAAGDMLLRACLLVLQAGLANLADIPYQAHNEESERAREDSFQCSLCT